MKFRTFAILGALLLGGCAAVPALSPATTTPAPLQAASPAAFTAAPSPTSSPIPTSTASPTTAPSPTPPFVVCSPLEGISIDELDDPELIKGPLETPRPGMDDGHHGVDFAYYSRGERTAMLGHPVTSVLRGRVAGVLPDRKPYGITVIIETHLEELPPGWIEQIPTPQPTIPPLGHLLCPADTSDYTAPGGRSVYLLYAHLNQMENLQIHQLVACGEKIGEVGTTGNSVNPHLHLESRIGPSGAVFPSMAHYDAAATDAERALYCTWRTSGLFQMFDPMLFFQK